MRFQTAPYGHRPRRIEGWSRCLDAWQDARDPSESRMRFDKHLAPRFAMRACVSIR